MASRARSATLVLEHGTRWQLTAQSEVPRAAATVLVAALWALAAGLWMPRGPVAGVEGVLTVLISLAVGVLAGAATRSRRAMLLAPATFIAVFELVRLGTDGLTVDGVHLSTYGVMAFVVGRGLHGVLALLPMPVHLVQGRHEARGRSELARSWYEQLEAPAKTMTMLETSGHRPLFE
jgi:pimeloyl-ACP methyl ester carboxylesterase